MTGFDKLILECDETIEFYTKHLETLRRLITLHEKGKQLIGSIDPKQDFADFEEIVDFHNYSGYIAISTLDLSVIFKNLVLAKTDWERAYFIKNSYLIIYEAISNLKPLKGPSPIKSILNKNYPELDTNVSELFEQIDSFRASEKFKKVEKVRHRVAGHIEKKLKRYYDTILSLDAEEAAEITAQFLSILTKALNLTRDYATSANKVSSEKDQLANVRIEEMKDKFLQLLKLWSKERDSPPDLTGGA